MEILFGDKVLTQEGTTAGKVHSVIVDADTRELTHAVVVQGEEGATERLVPLSMVQGKAEEGLLLHASARQLAQLPTLAEMALGIPGIDTGELHGKAAGSGRAAEQRRTKTGGPENRAMALRHVSVALTPNCSIEALDGELGRLAGVRLDVYTNKLASIVVARGEELRHPVAVPATWISEIAPRRIKLASSRAQAEALVGPEAGPYITVEGGDEGGAGGR